MATVRWTGSLVLVVGVMLGGCGQSADSGDVPAGGISRCYAATEEPVRAAEVVEAFKREKIRLFSDPSLCGTKGAVAFGRPVVGLANVVVEGPNRNVDQGRAIREKEGNVVCRVAAERFGGNTAREYRTQGGAVGFVVGNVDCSVHTDGDGARRQELAVRKAVAGVVRKAIRADEGR